jgi:membrane fusion protein, multidrug efflux system
MLTIAMISYLRKKALERVKPQYYRLIQSTVLIGLSLPILLLLSVSAHGITDNTQSLSNNVFTDLSSNTPKYVIIRSINRVTFSSEMVISVRNIYVREGSRFKKGDILLQLDCRIQEAELNKSLAQQKEAAMAQQSAHKLKSFNAISELELVKADADAQVASAEVDKLKAMVDHCSIKAPFAGSVSALMVHPYETVKPGDPLLKIVNIEHLEFDIEVPSQWLSWLHPGTRVLVHINELDKDIIAKIARINPQIEPVSQTVRVIADISHPDASLLPGMSGQATFPDNPANRVKQGNANKGKK